MKRLLICLFLATLICSFPGCAKTEILLTETIVPSSAASDVLISKEELIAEHGLFESEYLDAFLEENPITREDLEMYYVDQLYRTYIRNREMEKYDRMYLLDAPELPKDGDLDEENIRRVLWFWNPGSNVEARLFDFPEKKLYYGDYNILHYIADAPVKDLSEEEIQWVVDVLAVCEVESWEENYPCTVNNSTGWLFWMLAIEYNDGSIRQFSGSGSAGDNFPENYSTVKDFLMKFGE